ncbi:MAG: class I tRNA ligase family protein, partial [Gemmataceae bacterium]|nr:class I tRNA ligase family protein [Gemmataceae bacterium]
PHCWRCKTELLFRLVDEWFINMGWRDEIMAVVKQVTFLPRDINGQARELDWLKNMGDWMISKKRFWGLALPIWVCDTCNQFDVIGSQKELRERAIAGWERFDGHSPHRPWVDEVKIQCTACGGKASRVSDVGNPWLDAGIVPYSTMGYNRDRASWEQWFPADFITECFPGQFRNWFYAILAMSTMMTNRPPFKVLLGHALVRDEHGDEMHKSKGNAIPFNEAADRMGADLMRWMYCRQNPSSNLNFGYALADELRSKFIIKLWNSYAFFCDNARQEKGGFDVNLAPVPMEKRPDIDRWILSELQLLVRTAREAFPAFDVKSFCDAAETFVDAHLSNWYVRRTKDRFWKEEQDTDKLAAYQTLYTVLLTLARLFAPIMPFLTDAMYRNLVPSGKNGEGISVHLCDYPEVNDQAIDEKLSGDVRALLNLVSLGRAARNAVKIKVRQPLAEMKVQPCNDADRSAVERFADLIGEELNVKKVTLHDPAQSSLLRPEVKPNMQTIGPKFGPRLKEVQNAIIAADAAWIAEKAQAGMPWQLDCPGGMVTLEPVDVIVQLKAPEGWAGAADRGTQVLVDTRVTPELVREGVAREIVRHVNNTRKEAKLDIGDNIVLHLATDAAEVRDTVIAHRDYIGEETKTTRWATSTLDGGAFKAEVKVDGKPLTIELRKEK